MEFTAHLSHFLYAFLFISIQSVFSDPGTIGVNYGRLANNLPPPPQVLQLLKAQGITKVKIFDTDSAVLSAFAGSGISVTVCLPNEQLSSAAANTSFTDTWVQSNILSHHPNTTIDAIAVGNEVFSDSKNTPFLLPAMKNVYASLLKYNLSSIHVSSPMAYNAFETSYPPSSGTFKPDLIGPAIKPMLDFLNRTGSYLMVNVYPFFAYSSSTKTISLDYALFRNSSGNIDSNNGLLYKSLFEAQVDAVFAAMAAVGFNNLKVVVTETGWPSKGDDNEAGAGIDNAAAYNGNLVRRVLTGDGTPLRPDENLNVYLFALFNENQKPGATSERNYGLFYPNQQKVYDIPLTVEGLKGKTVLGVIKQSDDDQGNGDDDQSPPSDDQTGGQTPPSTGGQSGGQSWCVANEQAGGNLKSSLDWACGPEGQADCASIQPGARCFEPNTLAAHASYAFNSYYQKHNRGSGTCDFKGSAHVVTQQPKFGNCELPGGAN